MSLTAMRIAAVMAQSRAVTTLIEWMYVSHGFEGCAGGSHRSRQRRRARAAREPARAVHPRYERSVCRAIGRRRSFWLPAADVVLVRAGDSLSVSDSPKRSTGRLRLGAARLTNERRPRRFRRRRVLRAAQRAPLGGRSPRGKAALGSLARSLDRARGRSKPGRPAVLDAHH